MSEKTYITTVGLEVHAGAGGSGDADGAAERRTQGGAHASDLVLSLERIDVEILIAGQLVQDVTRWGNRIAPQEDW